MHGIIEMKHLVKFYKVTLLPQNNEISFEMPQSSLFLSLLHFHLYSITFRNGLSFSYNIKFCIVSSLECKKNCKKYLYINSYYIISTIYLIAISFLLKGLVI
jgi:hypothetical protein